MNLQAHLRGIPERCQALALSGCYDELDETHFVMENALSMLPMEAWERAGHRRYPVSPRDAEWCREGRDLEGREDETASGYGGAICVKMVSEKRCAVVFHGGFWGCVGAPKVLPVP